MLTTPGLPEMSKSSRFGLGAVSLFSCVGAEPFVR